MIELTLPFPPTVNHYKKLGRTVTTKKGKTYQQRINTSETKTFYYYVWLKIRELKLLKLISRPIEAFISVEVDLHPPDKRKRDIDNPIKVLLDSLVKGGLIKDDSLVTRLVIQKCDIIKQGQVILRIQELI